MPLNTPTAVDYGSRRKRRNTVRHIIACLAAVRAAEQRSLDNVPEHFQCSDSFESGERAIEALDEIIDLLGDIY